MKKHLTRHALVAALAVLFLPALLEAQVLMLDFGPTASTGAQANSPYHTAASGSFTDTSWNTVGAADIASGLLWSDGTSATGISLNIGATTAATTASSTLGLGNTPSGNSALGSQINTGIYSGNSVGTDGIFTSTSGNTRSVGFQLSGLAAGTYDIYVTARNTSTSNAHTQTAYVGTSSSAGDFVIDGGGSYASSSMSYAAGTTSAVSSWVQGDNYLKFTITLGIGEYLNLATLGSSGDNRGFLNSVQIVAVPEPSTFALLGIGLCGLLGLRFLRRRA